MFKKVLKWAVVGFVGLIALVLIIGIFAPRNSGEDESPSAATELANTPALTNTPMSPPPDTPTAAPAPTVTPEPAVTTPMPTGTSVPAATPMPTPTATASVPTLAPTPTVTAYQPCPTDQEEAYLREVDAIAIDLAQSLLDIDAQNILAIADHALLLDGMWIAQTVRISFDINDGARRFRDIDPVPDSLRYIHSEWETIADLYDDFVDLYMRGVDTLDGPLISSAGHLLINASQRADLLAMVIERFCE